MTSASSCSAADDDLLRRLAQAGVDHLHAGVAQRAGDDLGAAVVAVEPRLGNDDSESSHDSISDSATQPILSLEPQMIGTSSYSPQTSRSASHISPSVA